MKHINPLGMFDDHFLIEKLNKLGNPLEKLDQFIDWRIFQPAINQSFNKTEDKVNKGGRPAYDRLMLFKALIIQSLYNLSDEQLEYQIIDRMSFKRFLGLKKSDRVPDSRTYWNFREQLIASNTIESLFKAFNTQLDKCGVLANQGRMIDASFVEVPKQRNTKEENQQIKEGKVPQNWDSVPSKKAQKDTDARWTKKNNVNFYGYKNHVKSDTGTKLILSYKVTDAAVHDSQVIDQLLDAKDQGQPLHADSAYTGQEAENSYVKNQVVSRVNEKGYRNKKLTDAQRESNREKSKVRARVEHIFGFIENSMNGSFIRTIGIERAKMKIGMMNMVYNINRCVQLKKVIAMG
jgi:IS5 family transposase